MKRALVLAIVACVALVVTATLVQAHTKKYPTNISKVKRELIPGEGYRYYGTINSSNRACEKGRLVDVRINVVEPSEEDRTNAKGKWEVVGTFGGPTETFVLVSSKGLPGGSGHNHICKDAQDSTTFSDSIEP